MMKNYFPERVKYDDNYDDIYPSIVKQQPSHFKNTFLCLSLCFVRIWNKICSVRKYEAARNNRTLTQTESK